MMYSHRFFVVGWCGERLPAVYVRLDHRMYYGTCPDFLCADATRTHRSLVNNVSVTATLVEGVWYRLEAGSGGRVILFDGLPRPHPDHPSDCGPCIVCMHLQSETFAFLPSLSLQPSGEGHCVYV